MGELGNHSPVIISCHAGIERSRHVVDALNDFGLEASRFPAGTSGMARMNDDTLKGYIPDGTQLIIISDGGKAEERTLQTVLPRLKDLHIDYNVTDLPGIKLQLRALGINVSYYFNE